MPLLGSVLSYAESEQIDDLFAVTFTWLQQRWKMVGLDVEPAGPTTICDAVEVVGFKMDVANSLASVPRVIRTAPTRRHPPSGCANKQAAANKAHG